MKTVNWLDLNSFIETTVSLEMFSVLSDVYRARNFCGEKTQVSRPAENFNNIPGMDVQNLTSVNVWI